MSDLAIPSRVQRRAAARFVVNPDGCWISGFTKNRDGYAMLRWKDEQGRIRGVGAHRAAYGFAHGDIPTGMQVDHQCHDPERCAGGRGDSHRACVNPAHLTLVTSGENTLRGGGLCAVNARKTHCQRGHAYDHVNTEMYDGRRYCRECQRINNRAWWDRKRARQARKGVS